jgi:hypothetical protein
MSTINTEGTSSTIASFIRNFYKISDDSSAHADYTKAFAYDASDFSFQIGPMKPAKTSEDIMQWRIKGWEPIATRKHTVYEVFSKAQGDDGHEYMLYGRVDYGKKNGENAGASWAGRMKFDPKSIEKGEPKLAFYHVWLVSVTLIVVDMLHTDKTTRLSRTD